MALEHFRKNGDLFYQGGLPLVRLRRFGMLELHIVFLERSVSLVIIILLRRDLDTYHASTEPPYDLEPKLHCFVGINFQLSH